MTQVLLNLMAPRNVKANRCVTIRIAGGIQMGNDSRINPVGCPILTTITDFAAPYLPSGDLPVHFAKERLVMSIRAQELVILPDEFVLRIARNFTEFIVDVCDCALNIGNGHDGRDIERVVNEIPFRICLPLPHRDHFGP